MRGRLPVTVPPVSPPRPRRPGRFWRQLAIVIGIAAIAGFVVLSLAPLVLAHVLPSSWWRQLGRQAEAAFAAEASACTTDHGTAALAALIERLTGDADEARGLQVAVYRIPVTNAWALPGRRVIVTGELIDLAKNPDEVAGVLAHEIGHIRARHAEMQVVREIGVGALLGLGSSANMSGPFAVLRYSREAEREADAIAARLMIEAGIDTQALKSFFKRLRAMDGADSTGIFGRILDMMSTHPVTSERFAAVPPAPQGAALRPALAPAQWQALKSICG